LSEKIIVSIEARMGSTRLPGKVLLPVGGISMLEYMISRVRTSRIITDIVVATSESSNDDLIENLCSSLNINVFRGSEENVLDRVYKATKALDADIIVELTGDCPLIDPDLIDQAVSTFLINPGTDYLYNREYEGYPDGMDVQVFSSVAFERSWRSAVTQEELEHVSLHMRNDQSLQKLYLAPNKFHNRPDIELTLDEHEDYVLIKQVIEYFLKIKKFPTLNDIIDFVDKRTSALPNKNIERKSYPQKPST